jgi:hypothetical protein
MVCRFAQSEERPFVLKGDIVPGTSGADAYQQKDDGTADTAADTFIVFNQVQGRQWRALGEDTAGSGKGAAGLARMNSAGDYEIVQCQEVARSCMCQLTAAQTGSDASFSVDTITPRDGGQLPVANSTSATLTAYNVPACAGADNSPARIDFNETSGHWEVQWIKNTSQATITAHQVDGPNKKLQYKSRTVWANQAGSESGWTDEHTGGACP